MANKVVLNTYPFSKNYLCLKTSSLNIYFYLFYSQTMAASSETYEKGFHQEVLENVISEEQNPLPPSQLAQVGE